MNRKCPYRHENGTCDIDGGSCSGNSPSKCRNRSQLICPNAASWEQEYIALGEVKTYRPIHKILSDGNNGLPGCVDVCEKVTAKLLEAGFPRKALGLDEDELDHTRILKALDDIAVVRKDPNFTKTHRNERVLWCILEDDAQGMLRRSSAGG